jgi:DNA repair exonuclease SbcCD nuclease subunit
MSTSISSNTVIATADWHLGKRLYGLRHLEQDRYDAAWKIIRKAVEINARAILNGGDLLDVVRPHSKPVIELMKMHHYLIENKIPMLVVQGNHDRTDPPWYELFKPDPDGGLVLADDTTTYLKPRTPGEELIGVFGMPEKHVDKMTKELQAANEATILLMHVSIQEWCGFPSKTALPLSNIPANKWDYAVIGDIHVPHEVVCEQQMTAISPGSIEFGGLGETSQKRYYLVDPIAKTVVHEDLEVRPVVQLTIEDEDQINDALEIIKKGVEKEATIYVVYDPFIPGLIGRIDQLRTGNKAYIQPVPNVTEKDLVEDTGSEETQEDGEELTLLDFAHKHTDDSDLVSSFQRLIETEDPIEDVVRELQKSVADQT